MKPMLRCATMALLLVSGTAVAADGLREGKWEFRTTTKMDGMGAPSMPAMQMPKGFKMPEGFKVPEGMPSMEGMQINSLSGNGMATTFTTCVTNKNPVPQDAQTSKECKLDKVSQSGKTWSWTVTCKTREGTMTGEGSATYDGNTMKSSATMKGSMGGRNIDMASTTTGRYLGACDK